MIPHCWSQSLKRTLKKGCGLRTEEAKRRKRQLRKDTKSGREREREMCPFSLSPVNQLFRWPEPGWNCCLTEKVVHLPTCQMLLAFLCKGLHMAAHPASTEHCIYQAGAVGWESFCCNVTCWVGADSVCPPSPAPTGLGF